MQPPNLALLQAMQYNSAVIKETTKPQQILTRKAVKDFEDTVRDMMIVVLKTRGCSLTEIGKIFNLNKSTVSRIIKGNKELLDRLG